MNLSGKKILILSPQSWGDIFVSKHHYAIELARRGNTVYFLNPANHHQDPYIKLEQYEGVSGLTIVTYKPILPFILRFHFRGLFNFLMGFEIKKLVKKLAVRWDVIWDFEIDIYADLSNFGARIVILHPVDVVAHDFKIEIGRKADVIISVSKSILDKYKTVGKPLHWINHGLAQEFTDMANSTVANYVRQDVVKVGYVGNLFNIAIDQEVLVKLIRECRDVEFSFAGPFTLDPNLGGEIGKVEFIETLRKEPNVRLHGVLKAAQLVEFLEEMDLFILCYIKIPGRSDHSNSHKILEYLSAGKVIVSSYMNTYASQRDLIQMTEQESSVSDFVNLFKETVSKLEHFNSTDLQMRRRRIASENSYASQINRIEAVLNQLVPD